MILRPELRVRGHKYIRRAEPVVQGKIADFALCGSGRGGPVPPALSGL